MIWQSIETVSADIDAGGFIITNRNKKIRIVKSEARKIRDSIQYAAEFESLG
jgi:hypothetical protein